MRGTDADALQRSHAEGARNGRAALLRDLGELRDEWRDAVILEDVSPLMTARFAADALTAIIDRHAKDMQPNAETVEAMTDAITSHNLTTWESTDAALATPDLRAIWGKACQRHGVKWCNEDLCRLATFDEYLNSTEPKAAAAPAAPKEGECKHDFHSHAGQDYGVCVKCGERRKGGEG